MQATIHAILLIALPLMAVLLVLVLRRRNPTSSQLVVALAVAALGTVMAPLLNHHMCREGEPRNQWLILGPCLFVTLLLIQLPAWRRLMAAGVFVAMIGLSCHFTDLVHTAGWTGNPDSDGLARAFFLSFQKSALAVAEDEDATLTLEQGWLRDTPIWNALKGHGGDRLPPRRQLQKAWHTPLTGLYPCTTVPQDIWTPGGPVREAVAQMEFRDRAAPSHGATGD